MLIAIISDIHDNHVNLEKFLKWANSYKVDKIICCGDITNKDTLDILAQNFRNEIHLVKGNAEIYSEKDLPKHSHIVYYGKTGDLQLSSKRIGICHEDFLITKILERGKYDFVFYGHTHQPWEEEREGARIINPGTLGGMFSQATFALWDTNLEELTLKLLNKIN